MIRSLAPAAIACALHACTAPAPSPEPAPATHHDKAWEVAAALVGDWIDSTSSDTFVVHETWRALDDSTLQGVGRVLAGPDTVFIEALRIERRGDRVIYAALPGGEANGTYTPFTCEGSGGDTLSFVNNANDFPKRIRYARAAQGWHAVIDENASGPQRTEHFRFLPR